MKKVFTFPQITTLINISLLSTIITIMIVIISVHSGSCSGSFREKSREIYLQGKEAQSPYLHVQPSSMYADNNNNYLKASSAHFHSLYADPSQHFYHRQGTISTPSEMSSSISNDGNIRQHHHQYALSRQETSHHSMMSSESESPHKESEEASNEGAQAEDTNPFEQTLESLSTPGKLIPIINYLTLISLVILHLPAIVPAIFIPLAFFCVGALLIPIVRVNYFINHKDDGEDGRRSLDFISSLVNWYSVS